MSSRIPSVFLTVVVMLCAATSLALMIVAEYGKWPDTWPEELEAYRKQAKTYEFMSGTTQTAYQIPFRRRKDFEKAWPSIVSLKSKRAPLILEKSPYKPFKLTAGVRILSPPTDLLCGSPDGKYVSPGPPWPESIESASGELPEYVRVEGGKWVPADADLAKGLQVRARQDIVLVCDGDIVDLNRIPLPPNTPIIDRRFEERPDRADAR